MSPKAGPATKSHSLFGLRPTVSTQNPNKARAQESQTGLHKSRDSNIEIIDISHTGVFRDTTQLITHFETSFNNEKEK